MNLSYLLEMNGRKYPEREALVMGEQRVTFREWNRQADHLAKVMQMKGVQPGDKVVLMLPNVPEFAILYFAVIRAGGVVVPIFARLSQQEVSYIVRDCNAKGLIVHELLHPGVSDIAGMHSQGFFLKTGEAAGQWEGMNDWQAIKVDKRSEWFDDSHLAEGDELSILYTSGTTGQPKGVRLSHRNVLTVATMISIEFEVNMDSRLLHLMPLSHSAPLNLMFASGVIVGAAHVFAPTFTPELLLQLTQKERTTHFFGAPVAYLLSLQHPQFADYDLSSVKYWVYGGAPLSGTQADCVGEGFGLDKLVCVYGLTEAGPSGTLLRHRDFPHKAGSIGNRGALFTEVEIVDDSGQVCQPGQVGEIRLRGKGNMLGYLNKPEETAVTLRDNWVYTGDVARRDEDGFMWVVDRKKDVIISGGMNIYPKEVELALEEHPDINELAVVGVPHVDWGETVKAFIVPHPDSAERTEDEWLGEVRTFLRDRLADNKIPRLVEAISELPRNASGKTLKHVLRNGNLKAIK